MIDIEEYMNQYNRSINNITLDAVHYFLREKYNDFQKDMKIIHVAGTNGKGSVVETISNILIKQGYKVGTFISPHLIRYNERIKINNNEITDEELSDFIEELEPQVEEYNSGHEFNLTFFELATIIAFLYFYRNKVDFVVLEVGLGGKFDSTNIITNPLVSIITSIGYDHMAILGETLEKIAEQKAGIVKPNSNTVIFSQSEEVNDIFIKKCEECSNKLHIVENANISNYRYDYDYQYFDYKNFKNITINLKGPVQVRNAAICIETMRVLNQLGYIVSEESLRLGLKTVVHKGRMEEISSNPKIIFDGAHNEPATKNLRDMIKMYYPNPLKRLYIVSILKRKDYKKMIQLMMEDEESKFIFTSGNDETRYISGETLYQIACKYKKNQDLSVDTIQNAIKLAKEGNYNVTFVVGSFYVYKDVINLV